MTARLPLQVVTLPQRWQLEEEFVKWVQTRHSHTPYQPRWRLWPSDVSSFDGRRPWDEARGVAMAEASHLRALWLAALHRCPERKEFKVELYSKRSFTYGT